MRARGPGEKSKRRCTRCKALKAWRGFPRSRARRCIACWADYRRACAHCGAEVPEGIGAPRQFCDAPECVSASRQAAVAARRAKPKPKLRKCPSCDVRKPLTEEFWYVSVRGPNGEMARADGYCRSCKKADQRARYQTSERRQAQNRARAARQRERIRERMEADPVFAAEERERRRAWAAGQRRRVADRVRVDHEGAGRVPAGPLADAIGRHIHRRQLALVADPLAGDGANVSTDASTEMVCADLGVPARTYRRWVSGQHELASADLVDRVLLALGLHWWDVYDEGQDREAYARAEAVFA